VDEATLLAAAQNCLALLALFAVLAAATATLRTRAPASTLGDPARSR
jgi:hypothetical protein